MNTSHWQDDTHATRRHPGRTRGSNQFPSHVHNRVGEKERVTENELVGEDGTLLHARNRVEAKVVVKVNLGGNKGGWEQGGGGYGDEGMANPCACCRF